MKFQKGQSGNPNGRPKGSENKVSSTVKEKIEQLLEGYPIEKMQEDLNSLKNPKDRLNIALSLMEFITPKMARTELQTDFENKIIEVGFDDD